MLRIRYLALAVVAVGALAGLAPASTVAAAQPMSTIAPRAAVAAPVRPQREIFGFAFSSSLADATVGYPSWNFSLLTTVAFFGLNTQDDGTLASDADMTVWNSTQLSDMVTAAHAAGTKVVVSIILQDFSTTNLHMCSGLNNRAKTVSAVVAQVTAKGVDGVNLDYEGLNVTCPNGSTTQAMMTTFAHQLRIALGSGPYLSVDTYAGAAADPSGFFNVAGLNTYVDSFFVMAYDLEYSNYSSAPTYCSRLCLGPTAPLTGYRYNETTVASQYASLVGAFKVILGVPYYGRKACVSSATPNEYPPVNTALEADSYLIAKSEATASAVKPGSYVVHRDANDPAGQERWDTWYNTTLNCTRELYWDDTVSLGHKYDLVNEDKLRGVGIFALSYGGGASELWNLLAVHFTTPFATASVGASPTSTRYTVTANANYSGTVATFDVISFDLTAGKGRFLDATGVPATSSVSGTWTGTATVYGYPGHHYEYWVRAVTAEGKASPWSAAVETTVSSSATSPLAFKGLYALRSDGYLKPYTSPSVATWQYSAGLARAAHPLPGASSPAIGAVLNAHGALISYGEKLVLHTSVYWATLDMARDFAFLPNGTGGYVLDEHGRLWPFAVGSNAMPRAVHGNPTWPTKDIARKVVILPSGKGGYVLDYTGVVNPFAIGANAVPAKPLLTKHWPGVDFARDIVLIPGAASGYVLNGYGGMYPFTAPGETTPVVPAGSPYWYGHNVARGFFLLPGSTAASPGGFILDCAAGLTPWGNAPAGGTSGTMSCGAAKAITGG
ncbi:MAG TPA: glycosyl hydrolase family 18 protein [Clostridia bacterium]|nr:glycosyl hydrolase family 18 protein [Clostridia bacterium]